MATRETSDQCPSCPSTLLNLKLFLFLIGLCTRFGGHNALSILPKANLVDIAPTSHWMHIVFVFCLQSAIFAHLMTFWKFATASPYLEYIVSCQSLLSPLYSLYTNMIFTYIIRLNHFITFDSLCCNCLWCSHIHSSLFDSFPSRCSLLSGAHALPQRPQHKVESRWSASGADRFGNTLPGKGCRLLMRCLKKEFGVLTITDCQFLELRPAPLSRVPQCQYLWWGFNHHPRWLAL